MKKVFVILLSMLALFSSCELAGNSDKGEVRVIVGEGNVRGIDSVSLDIHHYTIRIKNEAKQAEQVFENVARESGELRAYVESGSTVVTVDAYNASGNLIGKGESEAFDVVPGKLNTVTVVVDEIEGNGSLKVNIRTTADGPMKARVFSASADIESDQPLKEIALTEAYDVFSGSEEFSNGYYMVLITNGENAPLSPVVSVRIVAGFDTVMNASISDSWQLEITITNQIEKTPSLTLSGISGEYRKGDMYSISAAVTNMLPTSYKWYMDTTLLAETTENRYSGMMSDAAIGRHSFTCVATDGVKTWAETAAFEIVYGGDRPITMKVSGKVEIALVGNVLVPDDISVDVRAGIDPLATLSIPRTSKVVDLPEEKEIGCSVSGADGYSYYMEKKAVEDRTVLFIVLDKNIADPAYLDVSFTQRFKINDNESMGVYVRGNAAVAPGEIVRGTIAANNWYSQRTIKIEPGTYFVEEYGYDYASWFRRVIGTDNSEFTLSAGASKQLEITHAPYATVKVNITPELDNDKYYLYEYHNIDIDMIGPLSSMTTFDAIVRPSRLAIWHGFGDTVEYWDTGDIDLIDGVNEPVFHKRNVEIVHTGVEVKTGENCIVQFETDSIIPSKAIIMEGIGNHYPYFLNKPMSFVSKETGEFKFYSVFLEDYDWTVKHEIGTAPENAGAHIFTIQITLKSEKASAPVTIELRNAYDAVEDAKSCPLIGYYKGTVCKVPCNADTVTLKFPAGLYRYEGSMEIENAPRHYLIIEETNFTVSPDVPLTLHVKRSERRF